MGVLLIAEVNGGALALDATAKALTAARSLGPALFAGSGALSQLWLFIVAPCLGAAVAGLMFKSGMLEAKTA